MGPSKTTSTAVTPPLTWENAATSNHIDVIVTPPTNDRRMTLTPRAAQVEHPANPACHQLLVKWLFDTAGPTWEPSRDDVRARNQATVVAARALALGLAPTGQMLELRNSLERERPKPKPQHRRPEIAGLTVACVYLRHAIAGEISGVVNGELVDPETLTLDSKPDAVASYRDGRWVFDVISLAKRSGQFRSDCGAGRVQRCLRLAERLAVEEQASSLVRVYGLQVVTEPVAVVEVRLLDPPAARPPQRTDESTNQSAAGSKAGQLVELRERVEVAS